MARTAGEGRNVVKAPEQVNIGPLNLPGELFVPDETPGLVVFAHGSGSSRFSPRNRLVGGILNDHGLGTLLFDLLRASEAADRAMVFDIDLLASRVCEAIDWICARPDLAGFRVGIFGASTGAAAALVAAASRPTLVGAVVSRGGRPDLAGRRLAHVVAPTLLIVGGDDHAVLQLNREALEALGCPKRLQIVPGATHLFEEPGTLEIAAGLAAGWFCEHLAPRKMP
jgi:putative phosphoribosyl transferase